MSRFLPAIVSFVLLALGSASAQPSPPGRPNVIVFSTDDLGYGDLGSFGSPDARTPHLDALAGRGLRLTDFYAGGPVCTPSRYALLTGLHTFRAGDPELLGALQGGDSGINDDAITLAEALRADGYETAMIGKWHLGGGAMLNGAPDTEYHPLHHGFDSFFGMLAAAVDYNTHWGAHDAHLDWWEDRRPVPEDSLRYATHVFGQRAVDYIAARPDAGTTAPPFFLYLPVNTPHFGSAPVDATPQERLQLPIGEERFYLSRFDHIYPDDQNIRKRYLAMLAVLDDEVGRIVEALEVAGLMEQTVIWFVSDNGANPGHGGSTGGFRGKKAQPYEGGLRVPSFVVWEGQVVPGTSDQLGTNVDILPTVLALADLGRDHAVDGLDLSPHLLGGLPFGRGVAVPNTRLGDAYRLDRWKLVQRYDSSGTARPAELYDLDADRAETTDLAGTYPDTVATLLALLPYRTPPGNPPTLDDQDDPGAPTSASLRVFPNPGPSGVAELMVPDAMPVRVEVFDVLGRRLGTLHEGELAAGVHRMVLPAGTAGVVVVRAVGPFGTLTARATRVR